MVLSVDIIVSDKSLRLGGVALKFKHFIKRLDYLYYL